ncbi:putative nuclease HARBI1 [Watersipora subatra]|uniref:putative nuclease HARBI1 n=1 Tax=Watersipora subatra TaxID=2589382 RepID=UPI00355C38B2
MESSDDDEILLMAGSAAAALTVCMMEEEEQNHSDRRKNRTWTGPITSSRQNNGAYYATVPLLIHDDDDNDDDDSGLPSNRVGTFRNYFRMTRKQFDMILKKVEPLIAKENTALRVSISAEQRLMVTLRYLATGTSMTQLHYDWCISVASLSAIIPETCHAIYTSLCADYLRTPTTEQEWIEISRQLEDNWNFPNALGALDGKHIVMTKPWHAGSEYHNYKTQESIILMAMCDANYSFTYVDVGAQGRASDGGVFGRSTLQLGIEGNTLNFPADRCPPNSNQALPHVILADEAFQLQTNLMRPYPKRTLNHERRIFNYRLSRLRRLIENSFGILSNTWRILLRRIDLEPEKTKTLVLACCILHNILRKSRTPPRGAPPQTQNDETQDYGEQLPGLAPIALRPTAAASRVRDEYCHYFNTIGAVSWQERMVPQL